jgi:hypothetical protein
VYNAAAASVKLYFWRIVSRMIRSCWKFIMRLSFVALTKKYLNNQFIK